MTHHEFAERLSEVVRAMRLRRVGEDPASPMVAFDDLPPGEQENWIDVAKAVDVVLLDSKGRPSRQHAIEASDALEPPFQQMGRESLGQFDRRLQVATAQAVTAIALHLTKSQRPLGDLDV